MKKLQLLKPKHKLIWQVVPILLICIAVATAFSGISMYVSTMKQFMNEKEESARALSNYVKTVMMDTPNIEWLLNYWQSNYESMDIAWEDDALLAEKRTEFLYRNPNVDVDCIPSQVLETLNEDSQKLYAEIIYMELISTYDNLKEVYEPKFLYCFSIHPSGNSDPDTRFFILTAKKSTETRGTGDKDIYLLGHQTKMDYDTHPILKKTYETGIEQKGFEKTNSHDELRIHTYTPIVDANGKTICLISVTMDAQKIRASLVHRLFVIEFLAVFIFALSVTAIIIIMRGIIINPIVHMNSDIQDFNNNMDSELLSRNMEKIRSHNEIGSLASSMANMGASLSYYIETVSDISAKQEKLKTELNLATQIQESSLPQDFHIIQDQWPDVRLHASMDPAKEVGGDFYDYIILDDDHVALVMADVSGKGVPAALFMMVSKILIAENCEHLSHPAEILKNVNIRVCEHNEADMFVTVWLGILELSTGHMVASNAGHEYPVLKRANGAYEIHKDTHSFVVGGYDATKYKEYELDLTPGDQLLLYTDGIVEATDADNNQYGTARLINILNKTNPSSPEEMIDIVTKDVNTFVNGAEQFDDMTMLAFFYK